MKTIIILFFSFTLMSKSASAQIDTSVNNFQSNSHMLFKKVKSQKTAAWILLIGGTGLFIAGESMILSEDLEEMNNGVGAVLAGVLFGGFGYTQPPPVKHSTGARVMAYTGLGAMLGSIPLFISGHKTKKKANLFLKDQTIKLAPVNNAKQLALGIKFNL